MEEFGKQKSLPDQNEKGITKEAKTVKAVKAKAKEKARETNKLFSMQPIKSQIILRIITKKVKNLVLGIKTQPLSAVYLTHFFSKKKHNFMSSKVFCIIWGMKTHLKQPNFLFTIL